MRRNVRITYYNNKIKGILRSNQSFEIENIMRLRRMSENILGIYIKRTDIVKSYYHDQSFWWKWTIYFR